MKKLEYEKPEIELLLIDPALDIITTSGGDLVEPEIPTDPTTPPGIDWD